MLGEICLLRALCWVCLDAGVNERRRIKSQGYLQVVGIDVCLNLEFLFHTQDPLPRLKGCVCVCVCVWGWVVANRRKEVTVLGESLF